MSHTRTESPEEILKRNEVLLDGHFVLHAGSHSARYVNKDEIYTDPLDASMLAIEMGIPFRDNKDRPLEYVDTVIGPAVGGVSLAQYTAKWLGLDNVRRVRAIYADKDKKNEGRFVINRGFGKYVRGKRLLITEDIITTGDSVRSVVEAVRREGGEVLGVAALCNRGGTTTESLGVPRLVALVTMDLTTWEPDACPLCRNGVPINTDIGHGADYVAAHGQPKAP
jgi:orotate phosphoribosyltransferase